MEIVRLVNLFSFRSFGFRMAESLLLINDREKWYQEKLEFICAVVGEIDQDNMIMQLKKCELHNDEEVQALMLSLLSLHEQNTAQKQHQSLHIQRNDALELSNTQQGQIHKSYSNAETVFQEYQNAENLVDHRDKEDFKVVPTDSLESEQYSLKPKQILQLKNGSSLDKHEKIDHAHYIQSEEIIRNNSECRNRPMINNFSSAEKIVEVGLQLGTSTDVQVAKEDRVTDIPFYKVDSQNWEEVQEVDLHSDTSPDLLVTTEDKITGTPLHSSYSTKRIKLSPSTGETEDDLSDLHLPSTSKGLDLHVPKNSVESTPNNELTTENLAANNSAVVMLMEDTTGDEQLAKELAAAEGQMLAMERQRSACDEQMARDLAAAEVQCLTEEDNVKQGDEELAKEIAAEDEQAAEQTVADPLKIIEEEKLTTRVAILSSMFPDAHTDYLQER